MNKDNSNFPKDKTYRYDDAFKAKARAHQFAFCENILNDYYEEKYPQVILSPSAARQGLIFCDTYRNLILKKVKKFGTSALFSNMLRSEHIPYNLFVPMEEDLENAKLLFNEIIGGNILSITHIYIEFAGYADKAMYLNDGTSFDTYIEYLDDSNQKGAIGIEVKYTENGYSIGEKEEKDIKDTTGRYNQMTYKSGYFISDLDIQIFLKAHHLRQIWRNHLLGFSMIERGDIQHFHYIHLYPQGNTHFHQYAVPEYKSLLTPKGKDCFNALTYEKLFEMMSQYFSSEKQKEWINYLYQRYMVK